MIDHDKLSFYCSRTCSVQIATLDSQVVFYIGKVRLTTDHLRFLCILEQMYHKTTKPPNNGSGHHESLWACNSCSIDTQYLHHISRFYASNMATTKYVLKYLIIFINIHTFITIVECILDIYIYTPVSKGLCFVHPSTSGVGQWLDVALYHGCAEPGSQGGYINGGSPIAGWCIRENPIELVDEWGTPIFFSETFICFLNLV